MIYRKRANLKVWKVHLDKALSSRVLNWGASKNNIVVKDSLYFYWAQ